MDCDELSRYDFRTEAQKMSEELRKLIELARNSRMTAEQQEEQRQSFAYGNAAFENERITRETVRRASENLKAISDAENQPE
jgi:hypothetical protein